MTVGTDDGRARYAWAGADPLMVAYHDDEWGVPHHDDRARLLTDARIVRNRQKVDAAITNAQATLALRDATPGLTPFCEASRPDHCRLASQKPRRDGQS